MKQAEIKYAKHRNGIGSYARVTVAVDDTVGVTKVEVCSHCRINDHDCMQEDWRNAAYEGALAALEIAGVQQCVVEVQRIEGTYCDTNPATVSHATALAVWKVLNYEPSQELLGEREELIFRRKVPAMVRLTLLEEVDFHVLYLLAIVFVLAVVLCPIMPFFGALALYGFISLGLIMTRCSALRAKCRSYGRYLFANGMLIVCYAALHMLVGLLCAPP